MLAIGYMIGTKIELDGGGTAFIAAVEFNSRGYANRYICTKRILKKDEQLKLRQYYRPHQIKTSKRYRESQLIIPNKFELNSNDTITTNIDSDYCFLNTDNESIRFKRTYRVMSHETLTI